MKVLAKPIDMVSWTDKSGKINPVRFRLQTEEGNNEVIKVDKIFTMEKERLAGNAMFIFKCQCIINNQQKPLELKYELGTCKWLLWKM
jgi:hypothetical protein